MLNFCYEVAMDIADLNLTPPQEKDRVPENQEEGHQEEDATGNFSVSVNFQQPPNSPDFNILDLSFHNSLQSLTNCRSPRNIQELLEGVKEEF